MIAIDEPVGATKARCMRVYKKGKPYKWGYKHFVLCGDMGFAHKIEFTLGRRIIPNSRNLKSLI
jgi:hypothetical protein